MGKKKPELVIVGSKDHAPTIDDIKALVKQLTGKDPTPDDLAAAEKILNKR